ncbi:hypothetical protein ABRP92_05570 [Pectobacterium aroidearum]|uniref:hypothetical protein n=1 Tax=Pectobacterium aroidearum TaxID=1201031 RepID=UPI0032EC1D8E
MHERISLPLAAHRAAMNATLFETIMDKANEEGVSKQLFDLITIACDFNDEISRSLDATVNTGGSHE